MRRRVFSCLFSILKAFLQRDAPTVYGVLFFMTVLLFTSVGAGLYAYQMHRETIMAQWEKVRAAEVSVHVGINSEVLTTVCLP